MADRITRTTRQGYFSRLASSFVGLLIGLALVPGSVLLMSWNEYRTVHRARGLIEAESGVGEVSDPMEIMDGLEGRLVHLIGLATTEESLRDPDFSIERQALRLERQTEMFQWVEHEESRTRDRLGGGRETVKTYEYRREWRSGRENSSSFEEPSGHENPQPKYDAKSLTATHAKLGAFEFRPDLVKRINAWQDVVLDQASVLDSVEPTTREHFSFENNRLLYSAALPATDKPQIGDMRIRFRVVEPTTVSVLSMQQGNNLEAFKTGNGESIEAVQVGEVSAAEMFESLRRQNTLIALVIRLVGWFLACLGFGMIVAPLKTFASVVPLMGSLVGMATFAIAFILGSVLALITIAIAWIVVRPLFGLSLLAVALLGVYFLSRWWRRPAQPVAAFVSAGPPPLPKS